MAMGDPLAAALERNRMIAEDAARPDREQRRRRQEPLTLTADHPVEAFGHRFARPALLHEALTHPTASRGRRAGGSYERLEFLGDRVLGLVIAEWIVERYPDEAEGELGLRNAVLTSSETASRVAIRAGLDRLVRVQAGEIRSGLRARPRVLADATEAVLGAIFQDGGLDAARTAIRTLWAEELDRTVSPPKDPKTALQEWALGRGRPLPVYSAVGRIGPAHAPRFRIAVEVAGQNAEGEGTTKRAAEREAAAVLLARLEGGKG